MAKFDVESAYRSVSIHPSDGYLLGMKWHKKSNMWSGCLLLVIDLRSAPFITDMVEWILINNGMADRPAALPRQFHYQRFPFITSL